MARGTVESSRARRARLAVAAMFLTNGAIFANLVPRFPELKTDLALSNTAYGVAVAAFPAGALVAGLAAGSVVRRLTSARTTLVCTLGIAALVFVAGSAPTPLLLAAALFVGGAFDSVTDVAQNAHGLRVQRVYGRSIINSLHAIWSAGAVLGGAMGAAAIALQVPRSVHLGVSAVVFGAVAVAAYPFLLKGPDNDDHPDTSSSTSGWPGWRIYAALLALVVIATAGAVVEDAGSSWATLYLRDGLGAVGALAASGYVALLGAQFIGRIVGDRLVDRFGERAVARVGGLVAAAGMGLALAYPSVPGTIAGFAVAGLGMATTVPAAMHAADRLPGLRPGTGLTAVAWLMRVGFVAAPPVVGLIADATSLRVGLLLVPAAGLAVIATAGALSARRPPTRS
ncbi:MULTISPECIES: MFS transporter [unclassified Mycobacterium]|uniref:MFS transporter n=1 Tax=unclassified Mycobacterium TaxID=2642494 RepID=UPI0029C62D2B|nr:MULTISPECIES: MFS transporter [unclassified Mycobacterium]